MQASHPLFVASGLAADTDNGGGERLTLHIGCASSVECAERPCSFLHVFLSFFCGIEGQVDLTSQP